MLGLSSSVVLQLAILTGGPTPYDIAFEQAQSQQRPLLVLVGADWCPGCQTMKLSVMPRLASRGALGPVSYAAVDADSERELATQLMRGSSIPQLIVFSKRADGQWHREQLVGSANEAAVQSLISRAVAAQHSQTGE